MSKSTPSTAPCCHQLLDQEHNDQENRLVTAETLQKEHKEKKTKLIGKLKVVRRTERTNACTKVHVSSS